MRSVIWFFAISILSASPVAQAQTATFSSNDEPALDWVRRHLHPVTTIDPGAARGDLAWFGERVGDARIVGLGEETHGSGDMFKAKHRLIRYLVEQKGFDALALELNFAHTQRLNDYVLNGVGDPAQLAGAISSWPFAAEEIVDLLTWLRRHNQSESPEKRVRLYGFDQLSYYQAVRAGLDFLDAHDRIGADSLRTPFASLLGLNLDDREDKATKWSRLSDDLDRAQADILVAATEEVVDHFDRHRARLVQQSSEEAWSLARQNSMVALNSARQLAHTRRWWSSQGRAKDDALAARLKEGRPGLLAYFERHDPLFADRVRPLLDTSQRLNATRYRDAMAPHERYALHNMAAAISARLKVRAAYYRGVSSQQELARMEAHASDIALFLTNLEEYLSLPNHWFRDRRDSGLAQTVAWIADTEGPDSKVIVWAHNAHISKRPSDPGMGFLGTELARLYGDKYVALGTIFNRGSFRASVWPPPAAPSSPRREVFRVGNAAPGSIEHLFSRAAAPRFMIDLRQLPASEGVWFRQPHLQRDIGNRFTAGKEEEFYETIVLPDEFDLILFLDEIKPATPLKKR